MLQLSLLESNSAATETKFEARTLLCDRQSLLGAFDIEYFLPNNGRSEHLVYAPVYPDYVGCVWRYDLELPWQLSPIGWPGNPKIIEGEFYIAVTELIKWRDRLLEADLEWINSVTTSKR